MKKSQILLLVLSIASTLSAQFDRVDVYPDLEGDELRAALVADYKINSPYDYGEARDILFGEIDIKNDSLTCVYTGYTIYLNPSLDPTETAFAQGINTEHTFPRSKGADDFTPGYRDMHHLFPTLADVNAARGSLPFAEIPDALTDEWFFNNNEQNNIPSSNIDSYSEYQQNVAFEPREDHKGNVARSYFYFYTMYTFQADVADPNFFEQQRATMCDWHYADPVDQREWNRSKNIAATQGNENPFILDCRLARLYCDDITEACLTVNVEESISTAGTAAIDADRILISGHDIGSKAHLYSTQGQLLSTTIIMDQQSIIDVSSLPHGMYILVVSNGTRSTSTYKLAR